MTVEDRLFRWLAVLRYLVLLNAVAVNIYRWDNFTRPGWAVVSVAVMAAWTVVASWAFTDGRRRVPPLMLLDLGLAVGLVLVSPLLKGDGLSATVPGFWVIGALLAWAVRYHWWGGLLAGAVLSIADLSIRNEVTQNNYGNVFLMLIGGPIVGFMAESLQRMADERDRAERLAVAAAERARLARAVHDGVLQVLALVQRRGAELGGEAADLGRLAGEQESVLRTLIRDQDAVPAAADGTATVADLVAALGHLESRPGVTVATPGSPVRLPAATVAELTAVVSACLDNVATHVGDGARAWVLLEARPDRVELSVRDEGPGIPDGRLEEAEADGRLGVSQSIRGRIEELGGTASLTTGDHGTEWEFVVPTGTGGATR
jgi:signal transduction histidine kinase